MTMQRVAEALHTIRAPRPDMEYDLHRLVAEALLRAGISFKHETQLAPRCRIDFLCEEGIGIEIKRGKPQKTPLAAQLARYAQSGGLTGLIVVSEKAADVGASCCGGCAIACTSTRGESTSMDSCRRILSPPITPNHAKTASAQSAAATLHRCLRMTRPPRSDSFPFYERGRFAMRRENAARMPHGHIPWKREGSSS